MPKEISARVREVIQRTHNVKSIRMEVKDTDFKAGQFMLVMLHGNPALKRYLSISNSPTEKGYIEFTNNLGLGDDDLEKLFSGNALKIFKI